MGSYADRPGIRWIAILGIAAFVLLLASSVGLRRTMKPNPAQRVTIIEPQSPFDGERAYATLRRVVEFGPRPAGSAAAAELRRFIQRELRTAGLEVREHAFEAFTPLGPISMVNIYGVVAGTEPGIILVSNHYDTKLFTEFEFVGANDGGSTTAWMIEMARTLGPRRDGRTLWLMFFDGEEAMVEWSATDGLYGSRAFVQHLREQGTLDDIHAMINVDMIGDCYLGVARDPEAPAWLSEEIWRSAAALGYRKHFLSQGPRGLEDDHTPFRRAGIDAINLIDVSYGGSAVEHRRHWHTAEDTLDKVCWQSLQATGDVVYDALPGIERRLDALRRTD